MNKELLVTILPKGIKDISDIYKSKGFKSFIKKESAKALKEKPVIQLFQPGIIIGGKGRSFFAEYIKTLPTISFDKLSTSKRVLGRMVMILNVDEAFDKKKN